VRAIKIIVMCALYIAAIAIYLNNRGNLLQKPIGFPDSLFAGWHEVDDLRIVNSSFPVGGYSVWAVSIPAHNPSTQVFRLTGKFAANGPAVMVAVDAENLSRIRSGLPFLSIAGVAPGYELRADLPAGVCALVVFHETPALRNELIPGSLTGLSIMAIQAAEARAPITVTAEADLHDLWYTTPSEASAVKANIAAKRQAALRRVSQ
jgi:hypothetical protein